LGNSKPPTYDVSDPSGIWTTTAQNFGAQKGVIPSLPGPANSGYALTSNTDQGQEATWYPYTGVIGTNPNTSITQWGYTRLHALQAWYEFNWNGNTVDTANPEYKEFLSSFLTAESFISTSNQNIFAMDNSKTFLEGVYSNMSDLITADVTGVSLATKDFGNDLINLGNAINLSTIDSFGLPSDMLRNLYKNNAITDDVTLALLSSGLTNTEISSIFNGKVDYVSKKLQQRIYGAFLVVTGESLRNILAVLKCKTSNIDNLADLLSVRKLFPNSYQTLTVPVYNISPGPTNSKTYYLIFTNDGLNSQLTSPAITSIIGTQTLSGEPPITDVITDGTNYSEIPVGFGSYLYNIIPFAEAVAAGAFSYSLQQVRNIKYCEIVAFAQVVRSMETTAGLPLTNGTDIPVDDNDWCYFLDDDNVVTWDLISTYNEEKNSKVDLVLFSQKSGLTEKIRLYGDGEHRFNLGLCDIASFMMRYRMIKKTYIHNISYRNADGHYALDIKQFKNEHVFKYCPDKFVRYNSLSMEIV
jgi:hypothetical protein